mgnify:CR=1 FL=1
MLGSDSYSNEDISKYYMDFIFRQKNRRTREKYILLFFCLKLSPICYDSAVSYDTFIIYSASIRFRPYRL